MSRGKKLHQSLPPDLLLVEEILTSKNITSLKAINSTVPIKIQFLNPVEPLDIFFLLNWFIRKGLENLNVDFYTSDPVLLKKTSEGIFSKNELENYCLPQNLSIEYSWLKQLTDGKMQIDPRLLLKIQFHWIESKVELQNIVDNNELYHFIIKGPVFSDSYEKLPSINVLPCYQVEFKFSA